MNNPLCVGGWGGVERCVADGLLGQTLYHAVILQPQAHTTLTYIYIHTQPHTGPHTHTTPNTHIGGAVGLSMYSLSWPVLQRATTEHGVSMWCCVCVCVCVTVCDSVCAYVICV